MSSLLRAAPLLALLAFAPLSAHAEDARGKIVKVDAEAYQLVLDGNRTFAIPEEFYVDDLEPGMVVVIQYEVIDGQKVIYDLEIGE